MLPRQIVFLAPGFPADESDTSCIPALQDFVLGWKEFHPEIQLRVIAFQYPHEEKSYRWNGLEVYAAGGKDRKHFFQQRTWRRANSKLKEWCDDQTILLSYFLTEATFTGLQFSLRKNIPHLAIAAGQDVKKQNGYLKLLKITQPKIVCFNERMSEELFQSAGVRGDYIIPMGVSILNRQSSILNRQLDLLIVGSFIPVKQVELALKIISELKKDFSFLKVEIIGDGSERKNLKSLTKELRLESTVHFTGALKRDQVLDKMQQAKILLHTSQYEGQSTVISEALACGMTVVCFDVGRIGDHEKIHVCKGEEEMKSKVIQLLKENSFDFSSVIPVKMSDTIKTYWNIIQSF